MARPVESAVGRDLIYGLRPEYMRIDPNGIAAEIAVIEPTGYETHMIVRFGGSDVTCVFRERVTARPGETIHLLPGAGEDSPAVLSKILRTLAR